MLLKGFQDLAPVSLGLEPDHSPGRMDNEAYARQCAAGAAAFQQFPDDKQRLARAKSHRKKFRSVDK